MCIFFLSDAFLPACNNISSLALHVQGSNTHNEFNVCQLIRTDLTLAARTNMFSRVCDIDVWAKLVLMCKCQGEYTCSQHLYIYTICAVPTNIL